VQVQQVGPQLLVAEPIGWAAVVLRQAGYRAHVGFLGFIGVTAQGDLLDQSLS